jgi:hypothetical protein
MNLNYRFLAAACAFTASVTAQQLQVKDHPLVSRFAGSAVLESSSAEFDEYPLVTGPYKSGKFSKVQKIEGKITHFKYTLPENRSPLEVVRSYQNALSQGGFQILFTCGSSECGDESTNELSRWIGRWCTSCEPGIRYLAAKLSRPAGDVYVAVKVNKGSCWGCGPLDETYVNVIEVKAMDATSVSVNLTASSAPAAVTPPPDAPTTAAALSEPDARHATSAIPATPSTTSETAAKPVAGSAPAAPAVPSTEIPSGTRIAVRMRDSIDSKRDRVGQNFLASLNEAITVNGKVLAPKGSSVTIRLVDDREAGKLAGHTILTITAISVEVNGRAVDIDTTNVTEQSASRTAQTAKVVGGTTVAGGLIGALSGGKKGAVIGAGSGAAAGTAVELLTTGPRVRVPSEAQLSFTLRSAARN